MTAQENLTRSSARQARLPGSARGARCAALRALRELTRSLAPLLALPLLSIMACSGDDGDDGVQACSEHIGTQVVPEGSNVPNQGQVKILDRYIRTLDGQGVPQDVSLGRVQATFFDISAGTSTPSQFNQLSDVCIGRVSRSSPTEGLVPLAIGSLMVEGTSRGAVQAEEVNPGVYIDSGAPLLGDTPLRIVAQADGFAGFDETIESANKLELSAPPLDGSALVELGEMQVSWNAGNGDFVLIIVDPDQTMGVDSGGDVVCAVPDDGCYVMPASVGAFLLASQTDTYTIIVSRHRYRSVDLDANTRLEIESVSEVRGTIKNSVAE